MTKNTPKKNFASGYIFALIATAIWSGNFVIARNLSDSIPPITIAFWRWSIALIVITPLALKSFIAEWPILKNHKIYLLITSILGVTIFNTLIYIAAGTTTALNLSLIAITFPVFILILSRYIYKEPITTKKVLGIGLVAIGIVIIVTKASYQALLDLSFHIGDIWMIAGSFIFAVYSILLKRKPKGVGIWSFQFSTFLLGVIFLIPLFLWEYTTAPAFTYSDKAYISFLYIGIFASLTAFVLWNKAILIIGPTKSGMIYYSLPLFSGLLAFIFLDEKITYYHLLSALLIISGILIANRNKKI